MRVPVTLARPLRAQLENTVKIARDVAEKAARSVLTQMAVAEAKAPDYLSEELKGLRRRLRAHGRALGDAKLPDDTQGLQHLIWEVAYEHWHRMLFARFLAENGLLMWEPGAPVSLDDCRDMVDNHPDMALGAKSHWELAGMLAARMLPQVFKPLSPVFKLAFAPEHQRELERLLATLSPEIFRASDSLGWVYQFWQAKRKDQVNASGARIGADELPAVTQLFTEPYMVEFLLHNSLGAWWVTRFPGRDCPVPLTYLRMLNDSTPAAGKFSGWPDRLEDFTLLDPSCGSGHFLVAAFMMLVPMRMEVESLSAMDAVDAVLADNLHGLELDARCVEIAVFALALAAWRFPDENGDPLGVRADMPVPQVACCGLKVTAKPEDWMALVPDDAPNAAYLRQELHLLHASFAQAPLLGSLLDPRRSLKSDLAGPNFEHLRDLLGQALATERPPALWGPASELQDDSWDSALTARGLLDAARLLDARYHLVVTNVPYLARGKQSDALKTYIDQHYFTARHDLATVFIERCWELACLGGTLSVVSPQNWWFLGSYADFRRWFLKNAQLNVAVALGEEAWEYFGDRGPMATLVTASRPTSHDCNSTFAAVDAVPFKALEEKRRMLSVGPILQLSQSAQVKNADSRLVLDMGVSGELLQRYAISHHGLTTGDTPRMRVEHWELPGIQEPWVPFQSTVSETVMFGGCSGLLRWDSGCGAIDELPGARKDGQEAWGKVGVLVSQMRTLAVTAYLGYAFDNNSAVLIPRQRQDWSAVWSYCSSPVYSDAVRRIDKKVSVTSATLAKVPFERAMWVDLAKTDELPDAPSPLSHDPTQWIFHGHPQPSIDPLQVAVARLVGYRWPTETDTAMALAAEAHTWIAHCEKLSKHADDDGIVCLPSVRGEPPADELLLKLLIAAWETVQPGSWRPGVLDKLLGEADCAGKGLDVWLRDKFFEQHTKRFYNRPFIWHVWDGLNDGFAALVNYHKLDAKNLERLIHTYLGDWVRQQEAGVRESVDGAQTRLAAAQDLKRRLELILEGEKPYDIFVRWKPLAEQPIGWSPDLNDGVRLNIRPFMTAAVLRHNKKPRLNVSWDKDRGKDAESATWFKVFGGDRINDHHLTLAEKTTAKGTNR